MNPTASIFKVLPVLALLAGTSVFASPVGTGSMDAVREELRRDKKALIASNLELTEDQATKFWPVYDRYQGELLTVQRQLFEVITEYASNLDTITDEQAKDLIERYLKAEEARAKLRRGFVGDFERVLPGKTLARFYQLENKIDAVVRFEAAAEIPLVSK